MRDTTATYQRLQLQIVQPGCPICGLCQEAVTTYLDTLLWESSNDLNVHAILTASLGFCGRHSRDLLGFGGQRLAAAVVERASLLAALHALPELVASTPIATSSRFRLLPSRQVSPQPEDPRMAPGIKQCPACVRQSNEETRGTAILLAHMGEFSAPLAAAGGLCLPHLILAVRAAKPEQRNALLAIQQHVWGELAGYLEEFIRIHNQHHHADPISERGRLAVERTIAALTGEFPVR
jgi:hypothetical protein